MISISQYHPLVRISTGLSVRTVPFHQISIANGTTLFTLDGSGVSEYFVMALLEVMGFLRAQRDVWIMNERRPPGASASRVQGPARQRSAAGEAGLMVRAPRTGDTHLETGRASLPSIPR